jgi:hypothetical protein
MSGSSHRSGSVRDKNSNKSRSGSPRYRKKSPRSPRSGSADSYKRPGRDHSSASRGSNDKFRNGEHGNGKDTRDVLNPEKRELNENVE